MDRPTPSRGRAARRLRLPAPVRRPAVYLGVATAGAVLVGVVVGAEPAAQAEAVRPAPAETVSVARALGLTGAPAPVDAVQELQPLQDLAASRSSREAAQTAAQQAQAAADQAELARREAEARAAAEAVAAAEAAARAAAEAAAAEAAAAEAAAAEAAAPSRAATPSAATTAPAAPAAAGAVARITNNAGPVKPVVQAAANAVVSNVPGAAGITLGGTRASAADPGGHPSGLALDYMVGSNSALGDAIVAYHVAHWEELGVDYLIWEQRMLSSPSGSWKAMADRGSATANHMDHPHVNYRG
ncbi:hypothetical protein [Geodermatophilus sp. DSM 44513]|uniref:hypothetical protein n=1 Tax=Geodermatophilus sp. DSM 44513 TaxID=1528104 RepID=UPI00126CA8B4|nr:hypothetical protein [Geodermatophilus sp. DSM 44513]WNV73618.1 hypothetical protein RTG05_11540 [Geodermatophilus sp. DSM 44513]